MPPHADWETRRHDERIAKDADQAELIAIRYGSCNLEAGTFDDRIADALDDYEVPDPQGVTRWAKDDLKFESATSDIGLEVRRRSELLGILYPFKQEGNRIVHEPSTTLVYEFCLAVSLARSLSAGDYARLPVAFERLVRDVLICFLGPGSEGFRTGWPGDAHEDRPVRFRAVVEQLCELTGEFQWSPAPGMPPDPDHQHVKDEGLDVVVWKTIPDTRAGKLFLLGQCACGDDYQTKFHDIDQQLTKLSKWMNPVCWASPMRVFSTPRHIPNNVYFQEVNRSAGLTLDRVRLTLLAEKDEHREFIKARVKDPLAALIRIVVGGFEAAQQEPKQPRRRAAGGQRSQSHGTSGGQSKRRKTTAKRSPGGRRTRDS